MSPKTSHRTDVAEEPKLFLIVFAACSGHLLMLTLSEKDLADSLHANVSATLDRSPILPFAVWNAGSVLWAAASVSRTGGGRAASKHLGIRCLLP